MGMGTSKDGPLITVEDLIVNEDEDKNNPCEGSVQEVAMRSGGQSSAKDTIGSSNSLVASIDESPKRKTRLLTRPVHGRARLGSD